MPLLIDDSGVCGTLAQLVVPSCKLYAEDLVQRVPLPLEGCQLQMRLFNRASPVIQEYKLPVLGLDQSYAFSPFRIPVWQTSSVNCFCHT